MRNAVGIPNFRSMGGCKPLPALVRFEASYMPEPNSGCWLWLGAARKKGAFGYGRFEENGTVWAAHRYSWTIHNGPIPDGHVVMHKCDNPSCVNPIHLDAVERIVNDRDRVSKGRQARGKRMSDAQAPNRARGERSPKHKLTEAQVRTILADPRPQRKIASDYIVTQTTISDIKKRKTWRHIS